MDYKKLEEINKLLKTTDIKGKDYIEVNERLKAFWQLCPDGRIETSIYSIENGICIIKAYVYENKQDERPRATGTAYEKEGSTFINKTSFIENCETSAVGRALGNAGIGINTSVASAEEVQNAILQQQNYNDKITEAQIKVLQTLIKGMADPKDYYDVLLNEYNIKDLSQLKAKDFETIIKDIKNGG